MDIIYKYYNIVFGIHKKIFQIYVQLYNCSAANWYMYNILCIQLYKYKGGQVNAHN